MPKRKPAEPPKPEVSQQEMEEILYRAISWLEDSGHWSKFLEAMDKQAYSNAEIQAAFTMQGKRTGGGDDLSRRSH